MRKPVIGQIGTGWIGKHYADDFERRGYEVVRYSKDPEYLDNEDKIKHCDIVFIAVPTPSTPDGFDDSIIMAVLSLVGDEKIAVIKSTVLPGTTEKMQQLYKNIYIMHSPEFLTETTAAHDVANPARNIIGTTEKSFCKAQDVMNVLPPAPYELICGSQEAELIKYGGNCWFYFKVVFINMLYDLAEKMNIDYETVRDAMAADKRIGRTHLDPVHQGGRGAGGHCFIKDMAAFDEIYRSMMQDDETGHILLHWMQRKNARLLSESKKDLDLLTGVYGKKYVDPSTQ